MSVNEDGERLYAWFFRNYMDFHEDSRILRRDHESFGLHRDVRQGGFNFVFLNQISTCNYFNIIQVTDMKEARIDEVLDGITKIPLLFLPNEPLAPNELLERNINHRKKAGEHFSLAGSKE